MTATAPRTDELLEIAASALEQGNPETTLQLCRELLASFPEHDEARLLEAEALRDLRDAEEAESSYRMLLARQPHHPDGWSGMGRALLDQGRFEEAAACFARAIRRHPGHAEAHHGRAMLRERRGDRSGAARDYARAWQGSTRFPPPRPVDDDALRALLADAAIATDDPAVATWAATLPIVVDDVPTLDVCHAYDPPASPIDLLGHLAAPLGDDLDLARHAGFTPSLVIYRRNLERFAWNREQLVEALRDTVISQIEAWIAGASIEA